MSTKLNSLVTGIKAICPLSDEVCKIIIENSILLSLEKGTILQGIQKCRNYLCAVSKGIIKGYISHKETKRVISFYKENDLIVVSNRNNLTFPEILETIETCVLTTLCVETDKDGQLMEVYNKIRIHNLLMQRELFVQQGITASDRRVRSFMQTSPDLMRRARYKDIASFLGIAPETFSRLKNRY